jgi:putative oxidoreductase
MPALGLLLLRLAVAGLAIAHGAHTLFGTGGGLGTGIGEGGLDAVAARFTTLGLPGFPLAVLVGLTQFVGGLLLVGGYLTRWSATALALVTLLLAWKSHFAWGFFMNWLGEPGRGHGVEFALLLIAACICLALTGGGDWSLDARRARRDSYLAAGRARLRRH